MTARLGAPLRARLSLYGAVALAFWLPAAAQTDRAAQGGKPWAALTVQEQQALDPLKKDWQSLEPARQRKWMEVASRFPKMPADERTRIQQRMAQWAAMTPAQRASARLQFQEAQVLSSSERQARWEAYSALPVEQRQALAQQAKPEAKVANANAARAEFAASAGIKNNLVKLQPQGVQSVSPAIVQAKPGATTTTVATRPAPPPHHHAGLPKIAATPEFVDPATLLPRRGAQAAARLAPVQPGQSEPDKTP